MPRGAVVVGVPAHLEAREFEYQKGDRAGEKGEALNFVLSHPATAMSGSVQMETRNLDLIAAIREKASNGEIVQIAVTPDVVEYERDGEPRKFFKLRAIAIVN